MSKIYMIVTNDEYETPVMCDVVGNQTVCDYLGISLSQLWRYKMRDKWYGEYKAIDMGSIYEQEEFERNEDIKPLTQEEKSKIVRDRRTKKHEESVKKEREKWKEYARTHKTEINEKSKAYYWKHREERCNYGKTYRREIKEGKRICCAMQTD